MLVQEWDSFSKWTIGKQWVDSADGIAAQMIEGYYRHSKAEKRKFFQFKKFLVPGFKKYLTMVLLKMVFPNSNKGAF
ncbi:MAG: hypothetical protein Kow0042_25650 [Calditrichia bacterium]